MVPIDPDQYPEVLEDGEYIYYRFWCTKHFITYEKYKNSVRVMFLVLPSEKEIFTFNSLVNYVEGTKGTEVLCYPKLCK